MNLAQLKYILAVDTYRHFARAAEHVSVTQPALSMMIRKLEEELGVPIFDRSKQPVVPTETGQKIIAQARVILREAQRLEEIAINEQENLKGELHAGIIPTLAPYLIPLFLPDFMNHYPDIRLVLSEYTTEQMVERLQDGRLDVGILVTPLQESTIREEPLFYEPFWVYASHEYEKEYLLPEDLNPNELWLLEEGHCFRSQIMNLCELRRGSTKRLAYEAGSIETLIRLVEHQQGATILPELATETLSPEQRRRLRRFQEPAPVREVSLVTLREAVKAAMVEALKGELLSKVPERLKKNANGERVEIF